MAQKKEKETKDLLKEVKKSTAKKELSNDLSSKNSLSNKKVSNKSSDKVKVEKHSSEKKAKPESAKSIASAKKASPSKPAKVKNSLGKNPFSRSSRTKVPSDSILSSAKRKESRGTVRIWKAESSELDNVNKKLNLSNDSKYAAFKRFAVNNSKSLYLYFNGNPDYLDKIQNVFRIASLNINEFMMNISVKGGGISGQSHAIASAIARSLVKTDYSLKKKLQNYITSDYRRVLPKLIGRVKHRKLKQFSKR